MIIGIPKERKNHEYRVGLLPEHVVHLTQQGHRLIVEHNAGQGCGYSNDSYLQAGAIIEESAEKVYRQSEMIVKVKEPLPEEYPWIQPQQVLFTYFHFAASEQLTRAMLDSGAVCIAYETITNQAGQLPLLTPMSEVAGRMAIQQAAKYLEKPQGGSGKLMGGVTGVSPANVLIIGGGVVGTEAAKMAAGMGAQVTLLDINLDRIKHLDELLPANVTALYSSPKLTEQLLPQSDVVVGAVLIPGAKAPKLISKKMLQTMKKGAVLLDVAIDQGGCFETSRPTTHEQPTYIEKGIVHYCVANIPGAVPITATQALTNASFPFVTKIAQLGWKTACAQNHHLARGLDCAEGTLHNKSVAEAFAIPYSPNPF